MKLNQFEHTIDFSFWQNICESHGNLRHYRRGEYFAHAGEPLKLCGWIKTGGFKHTLVDCNGDIKTVGFVFKNSILANYTSSMLNRPMPTDIIALRDSDVFVAPTQLIRQHLDNNPSLNLHIVQELFDQAYRTILDNYQQSAYLRYQRLTERCPRIADLVPLREIASYLNISLRQLHRFRGLHADQNTNPE